MVKFTENGKSGFLITVVVLLLAILGSLIISCTTPSTSTSNTSSSATQTPAAPIVLRFAGWHATNHWIYTEEVWFKNEIEKRSGGRLKVEIFPDSQLANQKDVYSAVENGVAELTWWNPSYAPGRFPLTDVLTMPFSYNDAAQGCALCMKMMPSLLKEYPTTKVLSIFTMSPYPVYMTKKQVKTLEDLKGLKIRSGGGMLDQALKALGAVPTYTTGAENYMAMQTGVLDGTSASWASCIDYKFAELCKYGVDVGITGVTVVVPINLNVYNKLPPDLQKVLVDVGAEWSAHVGATEVRLDTDAIAKCKSQYGMDIYKLPPNELKRWVDVTAPIWDNWVVDMEAKKLTGKAIMAEFQQYRTQIVK